MLNLKTNEIPLNLRATVDQSFLFGVDMCAFKLKLRSCLDFTPPLYILRPPHPDCQMLRGELPPRPYQGSDEIFGAPSQKLFPLKRKVL